MHIHVGRTCRGSEALLAACSAFFTARAASASRAASPLPPPGTPPLPVVVDGVVDARAMAASATVSAKESMRRARPPE